MLASSSLVNGALGAAADACPAEGGAAGVAASEVTPPGYSLRLVAHRARADVRCARTARERPRAPLPD
jgi:hypothetical protein